MRFLFGIITGAMLTMFIATVIDAPTSSIAGNLKATWDSIIETTSEVLFENSSAGPPAAPQKPGGAEKNTSRADIWAVNKPAARSPLDLPVAGEAQAKSVSSPDTNKPASLNSIENHAAAWKHIGTRSGIEPWVESPASDSPASDSPASDSPASDTAVSETAGVDEVADATSPDRQISEATIDSAIGAAIGATADSSHSLLPDSTPNIALVWTPFHSQRSAQGFAERLSDELAHPFIVHRQGAGNYQVTFAYEDENQRAALIAEISEITGQ